MPSIYTPDPTNIAQPADSDYAYIQAGELRALKQYLAAQLGALGGPVNPETLRDRAKNYIINGACQLAQEGAVAVAATGKYYGGCDLIPVIMTGFSSVSGTINQYAALTGSSSSYAQGIQLTTAGSGHIFFGQCIEALKSKTLAGRTVTVSCKVYQNTGAALNAALLINKPNALNDFSAETSVATGASTLIPNNTYTQVSVSYTLSATDVVNGLSTYLQFISVGGITAKDLMIMDFQLVESQYVTPFVCPDIGATYAEVGRFLEFGEDRDDVWINSTDFYDRGFQSFKYRKWAAPTVTIINSVTGGANSVRDLSAVADRAVTGSGGTTTGIAFVTTAAGTTNGSARWKFKATAYL